MQSVTIKTQHMNPARPSQYIFPLNSNMTLDNHVLSLISVNFYNSLYNIEKAERGNQRITIIWNADTSTTYNFDYPDSYMTISDLNYALQNFMLLNKLYMVGATANVHYCELLTDSNKYKAMIIVSPLPTAGEASAAGLTIPVGATWTLSTNKCPQVVMNTEFGKLVGFNAGTILPTVNTIKSTVLSDKTPVISPVSSLTMTCNLIESPYDNPSSTLKVLPITVAFGDMQTFSNNTDLYYQIPRQSYTNIIIEFLDNLNDPVRLKDPEISVQLAIKRNNI